MSDIVSLERFQSVLSENGTPSQRFAEFIEQMTNQVNFLTVATGSGSPEGVETAAITKLYMDTSGTAGNILYIKKTDGGDTGWVLV